MRKTTRTVNADELRRRPRGIGRPTSPTAERVSDELRLGTADVLCHRRRVAALSLASIGTLSVVAAYQNGLLPTVPEPSLPILDANRVDAAGEAYQLLKTPDASLAIASSAITLVLAGMGGADRVQTRRWLPLLFAAKAMVDAAGGVYLTLEQANKHRRFCSWCLLTALCYAAMVPPALAEARAALGTAS